MAETDLFRRINEENQALVQMPALQNYGQAKLDIALNAMRQRQREDELAAERAFRRSERVAGEQFAATQEQKSESAALAREKVAGESALNVAKERAKGQMDAEKARLEGEKSLLTMEKANQKVSATAQARLAMQMLQQNNEALKSSGIDHKSPAYLAQLGPRILSAIGDDKSVSPETKQLLANLSPELMPAVTAQILKTSGQNGLNKFIATSAQAQNALDTELLKSPSASAAAKAALADHVKWTDSFIKALSQGADLQSIQSSMAVSTAQPGAAPAGAAVRSGAPTLHNPGALVGPGGNTPPPPQAALNFRGVTIPPPAPSQTDVQAVESQITPLMRRLNLISDQLRKGTRTEPVNAGTFYAPGTLPQTYEVPLTIAEKNALFQEGSGVAAALRKLQANQDELRRRMTPTAFPPSGQTSPVPAGFVPGATGSPAAPAVTGAPDATAW